jgi:hypothetical protein
MIYYFEPQVIVRTYSLSGTKSVNAMTWFEPNNYFLITTSTGDIAVFLDT